jgi:hypothetical protein
MVKRITLVLAVLSLAWMQPAFAEQGNDGKKKKEHGAAQAARGPVRAHGAPAIGHAQAAQHAAAPARAHAQSRVVREGAVAAPTGRAQHGNAARFNAPGSARVNGNANAVTTRHGRVQAERTATAQRAVTAPAPNQTRAFRERSQTGVRYTNFNDARRSWRRERHDRGWWSSNYSRVVLYGGGYYYWDNGWWYPAYGYDTYNSHYVFDGPIYGYNDRAPGDVVGDTQRALAEQGYYRGPIDGIIGSMTRRAISRYQADHGLAVTSAIDQQTLYALGLA